MNKKLKKFKDGIVFLFTAILILQGCRTPKGVTGTEQPTKEDAGTRIISMLEKRTRSFHTMKARKVDVEFNMNGVRDEFNANMAMYRDSLIVVSVIPALGYEILRILCTKDSVIIINRPEKTYSADSFENYRKRYQIPVKFRDLQAILANEVFYYKEGYNDRVYEKQLNTGEENSLFVIDAFKDGERITTQGIEIDSGGSRIENVFIVDYASRMRLNLEYDEFTMNGKNLFPKKIRIDMVESNSTVGVDIHYDRLIFNDSINVEFNAPEHYKRGDL